MNNTKLELTWYGKQDKISVEPRILIENKELSYGDKSSENLLIHGDNLLALKALEQKYAGQVKCIYIDPPYNTGSAFEHYDDNIQHSQWLSLMKPRLELLRSLLAKEGSIWISIDDNERDYLKILCDEIFGRSNFVASVVWRSSDNSNNDAKQFSLDHNYVLIYSKSLGWQPNKLDRSKEQSKHYQNPDNDPRGPWFDGNPLNSPNPRPNLTYDIIAPNGNVIKPPFNGWRWSEETLKEKMLTGEIRFNNNFSNIRRRTYLYEQEGVPPSTLWANLEETGHNRQAKYEQKLLFPYLNKNELFTTPKPEKVLERVLTLASNEGDLVLDSFLGSGTTAAVAHKMGRRWIGIELGDHAYTHCKVRMDKVIDGEQGGISKNVDWQGGGGYKFLELADSLVAKDEFGQAVISDNYNADMLAAAMCLHKGYVYAPSKDAFWKQGVRGCKNFIFSTTEYLINAMLDAIASELDSDEHCLICATAIESGLDNKYKNISVQKIPQAILDRCEYGADNYNLNVVTAADFEEEYDED